MCDFQNLSTISTKNLQSVKFVIPKQEKNVTMILKIKFQMNERFILKKTNMNFYRTQMTDKYTLGT